VGRAWPAAPHYAVVSGFGAGPVGWLVQLPLYLSFFLFFFFVLFLGFFLKNFFQHCKRLIYTSCGMGILIFKPILGRVAIFLPFNSRFLDVDGQKLCEKIALAAPLPL
jgi:hypothetical protein